MKAKRSAEEQIIGILNEADQTRNIREICNRNNRTETTFYRWRTKFGSMDVSDGKWLRELEQENAQLKRMVTELSLDFRILKDLSSKNDKSGGMTTRSEAPRYLTRSLRAESLPGRWDLSKHEASSVRPD